MDYQAAVVEANHAVMNPSVGKVEAFGLLAGDVWAPERPSYLYNTSFNMGGSHPYSFVDDVVEHETEAEDDDGGVDWSHLIDIIDDLLEEEDSHGGGDEYVVEGSADQDHGHSADEGGVLPELPKPDDAAAADENPADPADDDGATREETPGTTFCFRTAAVVVPSVVSPSDDCCAPVTRVGTRSRSSSSRKRGGRWQRKKAPPQSLGAGNGVSCSTTKLDTARADGRKGFAGDLGKRTAAAAAAAPARRSTARSARGETPEERFRVVPAILASGRSRQQLGQLF
jgi:hypothetical protein